MRKMTAIRRGAGGAGSAFGPEPTRVRTTSEPEIPASEVEKGTYVLRAPLGTSARAIGLVGIAALAISPLALTLPAQATPVTTAAPAGRGRAVRPARPLLHPRRARAAIAEAKQDRGATADRLRLGAKEALVVKDVLRDADGTEHTRYNRTYAGLPVIGGDLVVAQTGRRQDLRDPRQPRRIAVPTTDASVAGTAASPTPPGAPT